nr:NAD(P)H-binding protein [Myxococcales bacterium]
GLLGSVLVEEAASRSHGLRLLSRREIPSSSLPRGTVVIQGDYMDPEAVTATLDGADAVLSTIGPPATRNTTLKPDDFGRAMEHLVAEMNRMGLKRIINVASTGTRYGDERFRFMRRVITTLLNLAFPIVIAGKESELAVLSRSDLDWTTIRSPLIRTGVGGSLVVGDTVDLGSRVDTHLLARFMLDELESDTWVKRAPFVAS